MFRHDATTCTNCSEAINYAGRKSNVMDCDALLLNDTTVCYYCGSIVGKASVYYDSKHKSPHFPAQNAGKPAKVTYLLKNGKRRIMNAKHGVCFHRIDDMAAEELAELFNTSDIYYNDPAPTAPPNTKHTARLRQLGIQVHWTEYLTPQAASKLRAYPDNPTPCLLLITTKGSDMSFTVPSCYAKTPAGVASLRRAARIKHEMWLAMPPDLLISLHLAPKTVITRMCGRLFGVMMQPQVNAEHTAFPQFAKALASPEHKPHSLTSPTTFLLQDTIPLLNTPKGARGTYWTPPMKDLHDPALTILPERIVRRSIGAGIRTEVAAAKSLVYGQDWLTDAQGSWAAMPTREQVLSTTYSGILDYGQNLNQEDDVLALRNFHARLKNLKLKNVQIWTLTLYAWAMRLGNILDKLLRIGTQCAEASPKWTLDKLCDKIATVIGSLPQHQVFGWPRRAELSTINRETVRGWKADAVIKLAIVVAETANRGYINAKHKEDILSRICNIHGLGGPYLQNHLWEAILDVTEIQSSDSEFLFMGSGSGHPHYAILRYHHINNTADLYGALKDWAKTKGKSPLRGTAVTPRIVAYTLCEGRIYAEWLRG
jgi:hypothetical protein